MLALPASYGRDLGQYDNHPFAQIGYNLSMRFEWNPKKAAANLKKHRVCFTEREEDVVRIFSARLAAKRERDDYEENAGR